MKKVDLVISYYDEDLRWIEEIKSEFLGKIYIYNKSGDDRYIPLLNIGQDSHTHLSHIIQNYDSLGDATIFLQGNPFDNGDTTIKPNNVEDIIEFIDELQDSDYTLNYKYQNYDYGLYNGKIDYWDGERVGDSGYFFKEWILEKFNIENMTGYIYWGQQFGVSKSIIHNNSKDFYIDLLKGFNHRKDELCHFIERIWFGLLKIHSEEEVIEILESSPQKITYRSRINGKLKIEVFSEDVLIYRDEFKIYKNVIYWTSWVDHFSDKRVILNVNEFLIEINVEN